MYNTKYKQVASGMGEWEQGWEWEKQLFCPIVWLHIHAVIAFFFSSLFLMYYKCENHFILFYYTHRGLTHALVQFRFFFLLSSHLSLTLLLLMPFLFFLFLADFYFCSFNFFSIVTACCWCRIMKMIFLLALSISYNNSRSSIQRFGWNILA